MRTTKIAVYKFLDKKIMDLISWLYLKHTRIHIKLLVEQTKDAKPYPAPDEAELHRAFEEFGLSYEDAKATCFMSRTELIRNP